MANHPRARRAGGIVTFLILLVIVLIGVGFWLGWFSLATDGEDGQGRTDVTLTIDQDEMRRDVGAAAESTRREAREVGEKIKVATDIKSVEGVVQSIDADSVTVRTEDGETQSFQIVDATEFSLNEEEVSVGEISSGDNVIVVYREGEQRRVDSITVVEDEAAATP